MNWEVLSAASSIISTLVIAASAVAAIIQLGHVRAGNAISGFIGFMDKWSTPVVDRLAHPEVGRTVRRG